MLGNLRPVRGENGTAERIYFDESRRAESGVLKPEG
jgi:hypothetical protein